jgi:hypothetical protein
LVTSRPQIERIANAREIYDLAVEGDAFGSTPTGAVSGA